MKLTFDLDGATPFELNAVSRFFGDLAKGQGYYEDKVDSAIETQGSPRKDKPTTQVETVVEDVEKETTSHEQLAADGAGLLDDDINEDKLDDVPPPVEDDVPPPAGDSELDSRGFPWDKRIHSANKSKNTDGTWRYSRKPKNFETKEQWNIYIEQIEEELKASDDVPPPANDIDLEADEPTAGDVFGQRQDDVPPPVEDDVPPPVEDDVPPPVEDDVPPLSETTEQYEEKTFGELMTLITSNQKNGSVTAINDVLTEMGIEKQAGGNSALPVLKADHPERISEAYAKLEGKL